MFIAAEAQARLQNTKYRPEAFAEVSTSFFLAEAPKETGFMRILLSFGQGITRLVKLLSVPAFPYCCASF
jgi:hypothetical protein